MDRKLLALLCAPVTHQPLSLLQQEQLDALNTAIASGEVVRADGSIQRDTIQQALMTRDRTQLFRVDNGIPVLLSEEAIATAQLPQFSPQLTS